MYFINDVELTAIGSPPPENFTAVRYGIKRKWQIVGLITVVVSIVTIIIGTIIIYKNSKHPSMDALIITSTDLPEFTSSSTISNVLEISLPLSHSLYYNVISYSRIEGYVTGVRLRLFTSWKGDNPLYIFTLRQVFINSVEIVHRYPVIPQTNNTQWQTIDIPFGRFPISVSHLVGVGMQDHSDTNQIYAAEAVAFYENNITNSTKSISVKPMSQGVAFAYIAVTKGDEKSPQ